MSVRLRVISLGAGVQSTTMALMAAKGEIGPLPDCAIFADTGWEPVAVQEHLARLRGMLPFEVRIVSAGNIRDDIVNGHSARAGRFAAVPWFTLNPDGSHGMGRRQCTAHYKLEPIRREVRVLLGSKVRKGDVEMWVGISTDEAGRMKPSRVQYIENRWPLIERRMSRTDCVRWLERNGYPAAPKSACIGCPFHSDAQWRQIRDETPEAWADAVEIDKLIRNGGSSQGLRGQQYMHASRKPLDEVDLSTAEDRGQLNLFNNECDGICGV